MEEQEQEEIVITIKVNKNTLSWNTNLNPIGLVFYLQRVLWLINKQMYDDETEKPKKRGKLFGRG
jgi:hypothetical protein